MVLGPDTPIARNPNVVYRELAEGGVLLRLDSGQYHGVNATGLAIWNLLEEPSTLAELKAGLEAQVEDPPAELEQEVRTFLEDLRARDLVVLDDS
jgi:hypothetical protein